MGNIGKASQFSFTKKHLDEAIRAQLNAYMFIFEQLLLQNEDRTNSTHKANIALNTMAIES